MKCPANITMMERIRSYWIYSEELGAQLWGVYRIWLYFVLILAKAIYPSFQDGYINHVKPHVSWSYASILGIGTPFWWSNPHLVVKPSLLNGWTPISYWWSTTVSKSAVRPSTKAIAVFMFAACQCTSTIEDEVSGLSTTCQIGVRPVRRCQD